MRRGRSGYAPVGGSPRSPGRGHGENGIERRCASRFLTAATDLAPHGVAVHTAARVVALAGADEIFVSSTTRDLLSANDFALELAGSFELKRPDRGARSVPCRWLMPYHAPRNDQIPSRVDIWRAAAPNSSARLRAGWGPSIVAWT